MKSIVLVKSSPLTLVLWWRPGHVFVKLAKSHDISLDRFLKPRVKMCDVILFQFPLNMYDVSSETAAGSF